LREGFRALGAHTFLGEGLGVLLQGVIGGGLGCCAAPCAMAGCFARHGRSWERVLGALCAPGGSLGGGVCKGVSGGVLGVSGLGVLARGPLGEGLGRLRPKGVFWG
jgi:hypothetical protein